MQWIYGYKTALLTLCLRKYIYGTGLAYNKRHQCKALADDVVVVTRRKTELVDVVKRLEQAAANLGLEINNFKTKYTRWTNKEMEPLEEEEVKNLSISEQYSRQSLTKKYKTG